MRSETPRGPAAAALDRFMPRYDVRERFEITIRAPASIVMEAAAGFDMRSLSIVKAIFRLREKVMRGSPAHRQPQGILEETRSLGWGMLAEQPGRHVVCGATCQPWIADVRFSPIPPCDFATYAEPDQVKIAWTMEAEEIGPALTRFAQETRAVATDESAKARFRRYWRWARFGIIVIRMLMLPAIRRAAERRWAVEHGAS